ncbi:MAG: aldehyde dehydrogenase (NADP(+)) [Chitinophagaceae bacterium]
MSFTPATIQEINATMEAAAKAFVLYKKTAPEQKALFLEAIAAEIDVLGDALVLKASEETNLPVPRLMGEKARTTMQLRMFATMLREGSWVEASIDTAIPDRAPLPRPDLRKMLVPLGPVIVFGASNFPFAYSTAGGDTASALAAGCPVVVKAHGAHSETSLMVFSAIQKAISRCNMPEAVVQHVYGENEEGKALVQHRVTSGVGFTGSTAGGMALVGYSRDRKSPIPVFSEMGSVNPVIFLPDTLAKNTAQLAKSFASSITLSMGQFCTNPGLMMAVESDDLDRFLQLLEEEIRGVKPARMLNTGIHKSYFEKMKHALGQPGVQHSETEIVAGEMEALPHIAHVKGRVFLDNPVLHEEVFGPYSIMVKCANLHELQQAWQAVSGQLTTTMVGTDTDFKEHRELVDIGTQIAGRILFNGVPTGVEVCASMVHGGPYPATTDSRFTAVGINAVKRWVRPVCFQSCPEYLLPDELKNFNERKILRLVNNEWSKESI